MCAVPFTKSNLSGFKKYSEEILSLTCVIEKVLGRKYQSKKLITFEIKIMFSTKKNGIGTYYI
jgi:hypothetical protein